MLLACVGKPTTPGLGWEARQEGLSLPHVHWDLLEGLQRAWGLERVSVKGQRSLRFWEDILVDMPLVWVERRVVALEKAAWTAGCALLKAEARILVRG